MTPNPYQPPGSDVADPPVRRSAVPAPVRSACLLILGGMGLSLLTLIPGLRVQDPELPPMPLWAEALWIGFFVGLTVWLLVLIQRRQNWARWTMLVLLAIGWIAIASDFPASFMRSPVAGVVDLAVTAMEAFAAWQLFTGAARRWFRGEG